MAGASGPFLLALFPDYQTVKALSSLPPHPAVLPKVTMASDTIR